MVITPLNMGVAPIGMHRVGVQPATAQVCDRDVKCLYATPPSRSGLRPEPGSAGARFLVARALESPRRLDFLEEIIDRRRRESFQLVPMLFPERGCQTLVIRH